MLHDKPWYRSLTIGGVLTTLLGVLLHPAVSGALPAKVATVIGAIGGAVSVIGLRRALPGTGAGDVEELPASAREWETTFNAAGVNPYNETREDVARRRAAMDATARDNRAMLMGPHYTPPSE